MSAEAYISEVERLIRETVETQLEAIRRAAKLVAASVTKGRVVHLFGTGHSHLLAQEAWFRAGGLMAANAMLDPGLSMIAGGLRSGGLERLPGYARALLDDYDVQAGDVIIVISNSGRNAAPVEMALEAKERGLVVVALTSLAHARSVPSKHASGKRLHEIADIVLDNRGVPGDGIVKLDGLQPRVGPTSTVIGAVILNAIVVQAVRDILEAGGSPPVAFSANLDGAEEHNADLVRQYRGRVKHL
jgi:uncharacterized phosphosugar-binding protein